MANFRKVYRRSCTSLILQREHSEDLRIIRGLLLITIFLLLLLLLPSVLSARPFESTLVELPLDQSLEVEMTSEEAYFALTIRGTGLLLIEADARPVEGRHRPQIRLLDPSGHSVDRQPVPPMLGRHVAWVAPGRYTVKVIPGVSVLPSTNLSLKIDAWWIGIDAELAAVRELSNGEAEDPPHEPADEWDELNSPSPTPTKEGGDTTGGEDPPHEPADEWDESTFALPGRDNRLSESEADWEGIWEGDDSLGAPASSAEWLELSGQGFLAIGDQTAVFLPSCPGRHRPELFDTVTCSTPRQLSPGEWVSLVIWIADRPVFRRLSLSSAGRLFLEKEDRASRSEATVVFDSEGRFFGELEDALNLPGGEYLMRLQSNKEGALITLRLE